MKKKIGKKVDDITLDLLDFSESFDELQALLTFYEIVGSLSSEVGSIDAYVVVQTCKRT